MPNVRVCDLTALLKTPIFFFFLILGLNQPGNSLLMFKSSCCLSELQYYPVLWLTDTIH